MTKVKRFDFSEAEPSRVWLIVGARNTGKTVLLRDILYKMRRHIDFAVAMTTTVRKYGRNFEKRAASETRSLERVRPGIRGEVSSMQQVASSK